MLDEIRPEGSHVSSEAKKADSRARAAKKKAEKRAMGLATGRVEPRPSGNPNGRPKSIVNRVTEYGALFNRLNDEHVAKGFPL